MQKVARLYRAVSGAEQTADEVESRLKAIRGALRETPAAEKQLGATGRRPGEAQSRDPAGSAGRYRSSQKKRKRAFIHQRARGICDGGRALLAGQTYLVAHRFLQHRGRGVRRAVEQVADLGRG